MALLQPCPNCGATEIYVNCQARGPVRNYFNKVGRFIETDYDKLDFIQSDTVRCSGCEKIRRDLERVGFNIIQKEQA